MVLGGIVTWFIKSKIEELRTIEEKLQEERRNVYLEILDPYIILFAELKGGNPKKAMSKILSHDYRRTSFNFILFASDEVVRAYNNLMQYLYNVDPNGTPDARKMMRLWGELLLEIRKSLGNKNTKLNELDMLKSMIKDIESIA